MTGYGRDVDEVTAALCPEHGERSRDAIEHALDVDVDHAIPLVDLELVEGRERHQAGVVDEHVQAPKALPDEVDEGGHLLTARDIKGLVLDLAAMMANVGRERLQPLGAARAQDDGCTALGEQARGGLSDAAARARDGDDLAFDLRHDALLSSGWCAGAVVRTIST